MKLPADEEATLARYREGPALLERALAGLRDADLDARPAKGGWTIRQIVHHTVDGDDIWKVCIKAALGNEQGEFTLEWYWALPQDVWVQRWAYAKRSLDESLSLLKANRAHVLQLLEAVPDGWRRSITLRRPGGETEQLPVGAIVEMQAHHVTHHLNRILAIREERGGV
jgi:uncharacterized damage-inducible protein DinB